MNIYIINGFPQSGKDTFVRYCTRQFSSNSKEKIFSLSTVDPIKQMLFLYGWDNVKTPSIRKVISETKKLLVEEGIIDEYISKFIEDYAYKTDGILFIFSREPEEIQRFKEKYGAKTIFIKRNNINFVNLSNDSDKNVENFNYDFYIDNNGSYEDLNNQVKIFLKNEQLI